MELWWSSLTTALQVFYGIAIATSVLLGLQLLLLLFGFDGDHGDGGGGGDFDASDAAHEAGVGVLSMRTVTAFFTGFGWGGVGALQNGFTLFAAVVIAVAAGGALMTAVFFLMRGLYSMRYSGTLDYRNAVGQAGSVYLPIPGAMAGPGQIEVLVQGRLCVVHAFTRAAEKIPNRARVKVVDVLDQQTLLVEPLDSPAADS
jgi:hypothetical protein